MEITPFEKLVYVETEIAHRKGVWADGKLAVFEAIAEDYRKQVDEDQAASLKSACKALSERYRKQKGDITL